MLIITLTKNENRTFILRNRESYSMNLDMPVSALPLPETGAVDTDLLKIEGNTHKIPLAWKIIPEANNVTYSSDATAAIFGQTHGVMDADEQVDWLENEFEYKSLLDKYVLRKWKVADGSYTLRRSYNGTISKITATQTSAEPVTFNASLDFFRGRVITAVSDQEAQT